MKLLTKELINDLNQYISFYYEKEPIHLQKLGANSIDVSDLMPFAINECCEAKTTSLEEFIKNLDSSFSQTVLETIKKKNLDEVEVYKKAGIDRKVFSKLRNDSHYTPSKNTAICLCLGLSLNLDESISLLSKAGYTLSNSSLFDVIIKYFLTNEIYDIYMIDEALLENDQKTLLNY